MKSSEILAFYAGSFGGKNNELSQVGYIILISDGSDTKNMIDISSKNHEYS